MYDLFKEFLKTIRESRISGFGLILVMVLLLVNGTLVISEVEPRQERPTLTIPVALPPS